MKLAAAGFAAPFVFRRHLSAAPSETVYHASFGAAGMAGSDIGSLSGNKHFKLVAVADVDLSHTREIKKRFPDVHVYQDWRELLDKEKNLNSVNVSTPDHMHAPDRDKRAASRAALLHPEAADADNFRGAAVGESRRRQETDHADGHSDPFARGASHRGADRP